MLVTLLGIVTLNRVLQPLKAESPMLETWGARVSLNRREKPGDAQWARLQMSVVAVSEVKCGDRDAVRRMVGLWRRWDWGPVGVGRWNRYAVDVCGARGQLRQGRRWLRRNPELCNLYGAADLWRRWHGRYVWPADVYSDRELRGRERQLWLRR